MRRYGACKEKRGQKPPPTHHPRWDVVCIRLSPAAVEILNAQTNKSEFVDNLIKAAR